MCEELGNIISYKTLYISVLQDRHSFKTKLIQLLGIDFLQEDRDNDSDLIDSENDDNYNMNNDED